MRIQLLGCLAGLSLLAAGCEQPENDCRASNLNFAARFTKTTAEDDSCRLVGEGYLGDLINVQTYNPALADDPSRPDLDRAFIAVKAFTLQGVYHRAIAVPSGGGDPVVDDPSAPPGGRQLYALGDFTGTEPSDQFCSAPTFRSRAEYESPEVPEVPCEGAGGAGGAGVGGGGGAGGTPCEPIPAFPALSITYDWANFKMVERSDAAGTAFTAQMTYSETTTLGGVSTPCGGSYNVIAIAPAVDCTVYDADGAIVGKDPALCLPEADPEAGRVAGSGLNPKLQPIIDCVDAGQAVLGYQCSLIVDTIEQVRDQLENAGE